MSALVELSAHIDAAAERLDLSKGAGADALKRHYITPTMEQLDKVVTRSFGQDRRPFKGRDYPATVDYVITAGPTTVVFRLSPTGFWVFGQYGTKPHLIAPRKKKRLNAAGVGHPWRGPVQHPGTGDKGTKGRRGKRAIDQAWSAIRHNQHDQIAAAVDEVFASG